MLTKITLTFHNIGLRSWIECDLCAQCPLDRSKGCCTYNPTYHVIDVAYLGIYQPELLTKILNEPRTVISEYWITVSCSNDLVTGRRCRFISNTGCLIPVDFRDSVCRNFICPGIKMWEESSLKHWEKFFEEVEATEAKFNNYLRKKLREEGINLKSSLKEAVVLLIKEYNGLREIERQLFSKYPVSERIVIEREIEPNGKWIV